MRILCANIFARFKLNDSVLNNAYAFYKYQYQDSDTPEIVAFKEYGDPQYHWIIIMINQVIDPLFEFPLQQDALERKIIKQYGYSSIDKFRHFLTFKHNFGHFFTNIRHFSRTVCITRTMNNEH